MTVRRRHSAENGPHASSMGTTAIPRREAARLYLVTPPLGEPDAIADGLADALNATDAFARATAALKPAFIAGCGGLTTRHDAMLAGESGADYVMFGEPNGRT